MGSNSNYFEYFDLIPSLTIDLNELEARYIKAFKDAEDTTEQSKINNAYQLLKDTHSRSRYYLEITFPSVDIANYKVDANFLNTAMQLFEDIEKSDSLIELKKIEEYIINQQDFHHASIRHSLEKKNSDSAFSHYTKSHYYQSMLSQIGEAKKKNNYV